MTAAGGFKALEEQTFLSERNVLVTNARLVSGGQTYAMSGVTSVTSTIEAANSAFPVICLVGGILLALVAFSSQSLNMGVLGVAAVGLGILILKSQKSTHHLILRSSSGEVRAISSVDGTFIARVLQAINNAIISRS